MQGITELGYVRFGVSDLGAWRTYLGELLGMEIREDSGEDMIWARTDYWHHRIAVERDASDDLIAAGLRVAGPEEFRAMQKTLSDAGIPFAVESEEFAIKRNVVAVMTLLDPSGIPLEIFHGPLLEPHLPFYPARRRFGNFVCGNAGIGHLLIRHAGIQETYEFYKLLGLRSASQFRVPIPGAPAPMSGYFMHTEVPGAREHTIAFGLPSEKRCNHLMLEVDTVDDVMVAYELIKKAGYPMLIDLGRHANDDAFSFYAMTPSGFGIEVSWGCKSTSPQSYLLNSDYYGHAPNPDLPAHMGEVDEVRKPS